MRAKRLSISAVPGSPKVTRCTSKPASFRIFSSTPSAPAAAGGAEGERTRARAMERASVMPPLNMLARRWASTAPNKFQLSQLVPIRGWTRAAMDRRLRVFAKSVGPSCPSQTHHFDKTPEAESDHDDAADGVCHDRQEHHAGDRTGNDRITAFGAVDAALEPEQKRVAVVPTVGRASLGTAENGRHPVIWSQSIDLGSISPAAVR